SPSSTESWLATASPPRSLISATTRSAADADLPSPVKLPPRSLTTTFAPREASSSACVRPRPPPAPVTIAHLPSNRSSLLIRSPSFEGRYGGRYGVPCRTTLRRRAVRQHGGEQRLPVVDQLVEPPVAAVQHGRHRRADHQLQRQVERARQAGVVGDLLAEQRARLREDAIAQRALGGGQHGPELRIGARRGAELHRDLEEGAGEALPEQAQ